MALTLKAWRRAKNITQEQMASRLNVHVNTYINWENDPGKMSIEKAMCACEFLNLSFDDVIFLSENSTEL